MTYNTDRVLNQVACSSYIPSSLRNVVWVIEGPTGVIEALRSVLGPNGTLVMPTMTEAKYSMIY